MEINNKLPPLPENWSWVNLNKIIEKPSLSGIKIKKRDYQHDGKFPVIDQGQTFIGGYTDREDYKVDCELPVIVFGDHTKSIKYVNFDFVAGADGVTVLKPLKPLNPKWFYFFLHAIPLPDKGYARHFQFLEKSLVPIPPVPEQHRIVNKIDELLPNLDAGVETLHKIKAKLNHYRNSVLKYAFEGKLTEEWRESNKNDIEPASKILERVAKKHNANIKRKFEKLPPIKKTGLKSLPNGWEWTRLGGCAALITKGESPKWQGFNYVDKGIPFIRSENVLWGKVNYSESVNIPIEFHEKLKRSHLKTNDVLINLVGASIGRCGVLKSSFKEGNINQAVALIRTNGALLPYYLMYLLISPEMKKKVNMRKVETARPNISLTDLNHLIIPVSPLKEQEEIVKMIEVHFSITDKIEKIVLENINKSTNLRQSILKSAFEGKLVPQYPNNEPASKLLERIQAEKAKLKPVKKSKFKKKAKSKETMEIIYVK